jgi:hypothetical protein
MSKSSKPAAKPTAKSAPAELEKMLTITPATEPVVEQVVEKDTGTVVEQATVTEPAAAPAPVAPSTGKLTAASLIGYSGDDLIRVKTASKRLGRVAYDTVLAGGRKSANEGVVVLQRTDDLGDGTTKEIFRWVDANTEVELLKRPLGLMVRLGGDQWVGGKDASGAIVEVIAVEGKRVTVWVRDTLSESAGEAKRDDVGELDSTTAKWLLDGDLSKDKGDDGKPALVSPAYLRTLKR